MQASTQRIRRVDVFEMHYHQLDASFAMSGGRVSTGQDATIVRLETDGGLVGWGEQCVFTPSFLPGYGPGTRAVLGVLAPAVIGADPCQVDLVYERMDAAVNGYSYAKSAIDIACWDLFGKATGRRIADLLGGAHQEQLELYTGVGVAPPEEMQLRCAEALARGYRQVQVKVGTDWRTDIARIEACVEVLKDADRVIVDANGYWPQADAVRVLVAVASHDLYVEQPCASIEECAQVRRSVQLPLILDESLASVGDIIRAHSSHALDAVRLKLARLGGITPMRRARDVAASLGLAMTIEDSGGGDIVTAAVTHAGCSVKPRLLLGGYLPSEMVKERIAQGTPAAERGNAQLPTGPGLGIELDEEMLGSPVFRVE